MSFGTNTEPYFTPREILLAKINFPGQTEKQRPILVISKFSDKAFEPPSNILICLPITSSPQKYNFKIRIEDQHMESQPLPKVS